MADLLTAAQMRAVERAAMDSGQVTGLELMERAGQGVVDAIFEQWPVLRDRGASPSTSLGYLGPDEEDPLRAVVLCGPGNNGGDGFVVARLLHELGWVVRVCLYGDPEKLPPDARVNCDRWTALGQVEAPVDAVIDAEGAHLVVDALFGTGLARPVEIDLRDICKVQQGDKQPFWVAIDVPSGLCSDSGRILGRCRAADLTVTFHTEKPGQHLADGPEMCGRLSVRSIGLEGWTERVLRDGSVQRLDAPTVPLSKVSAHKFSHGHALILSGGSGKTGAARLSARGALRVGAGLVTLGVPPAAQLEVAAQVTAIMLARVDGARGLSDVLSDQRLNALCLGPGLGVERSRELVPVALSHRRATVLDADALTAFAEDPSTLFAQLHQTCVLTPHGGEFARLFPDLAEALAGPAIKGPAFSKTDATREAAKRAGCIVLFKGADTVIAAPDGRCSIHAATYEHAAPWLATAGAGDVLAGFISGLLARGFEPMRAAETGAWLHAECARSFGPGLIAEDLPEALPKILKKMNI